MVSETMNIHKALTELKTIDARITKGISAGTYVFANKQSNTKVGGEPIDKVCEAVKSHYQSVADLILRRNAIKQAVVLSNAATKVVIAGKHHVVISSVEHDSVRTAATTLEELGIEVSLAQPDENGQITVDSVARVMRPETGLVSVMHTNNETGVSNDIRAIGRLCKERDVLFHSDCVQAAGESRLDVNELGVDFATVSAHKINGPKGVGAIYVGRNVLSPIISGGSNQEFGLRGGTENVPGIIGFGVACKEACENLEGTLLHTTMCKQEFAKTLLSSLGETQADRGVTYNMNSHLLPGKILSISVDRVFGETLVLMLSTLGIYISAGSACRSHESNPSKTLLACGLSTRQALNTVRVSFSKENSVDDVCYAAETMASLIKTLRETGAGGD